jgi:hypothetical protein
LYAARQAYRKVSIECFKKKRTEKDGNDSTTLDKALKEAWEAMKKEQVCHL